MFRAEIPAFADCVSEGETLGIAGGIHKRRWEALGEIDDLRRSFQYYLRGYRQGIAQDMGYTAINAAFVLDLLNFLDDTHTVHDIDTTKLRAEIVSEIGHLRLKLQPKAGNGLLSIYAARMIPTLSANDIWIF